MTQQADKDIEDMKKTFKIVDLGVTELPEELHLLAVQKIKEADEEIEQIKNAENLLSP